MQVILTMNSSDSLWYRHMMGPYRQVVRPGAIILVTRHEAKFCLIHSWWRHQMETFSVLLVLCEGNPPVAGGLPSQVSDAEFWRFLWCAPEYDEQTVGMLVNLDAMRLIATSLQCLKICRNDLKLKTGHQDSRQGDISYFAECCLALRSSEGWPDQKSFGDVFLDILFET